jgi:hypothetical protein
VLRRVASNGIISVDNQMLSVGNAYNAELVNLMVDDSVIQVWSKNHLIKTVAREREGRVRKIRADGLHVKASTEHDASSIRVELKAKGHLPAETPLRRARHSCTTASFPHSRDDIDGLARDGIPRSIALRGTCRVGQCPKTRS